MKNVTVTLPEEIALWLRAQAAENGRSVSRWLADLLERMRRQDDEYEAAMERALAIQPEKLNKAGAPYPSRSIHYDRADIR